MVGLQPAQEFLADRRVSAVFSFSGERSSIASRQACTQGAPVLDGCAHLGQHAAKRAREIVEQQQIGLTVDLDVHHRLRPRLVAGIDADGQEVPIEVAARAHHRMSKQMHGDARDA